MNFGVLKESEISSPLEGLAVVRPKKTKRWGAVASGLMLTSLVDVFSLLVIYLLVNTSASKATLKLDKPIQLPQARYGQLLEGGVNVEVVGDKYYINKELTSFQKLSSTLKEVHESMKLENKEGFDKLIIQADKEASFEPINSLLILSADAGFEHIKFATINRGS